MILQWTSAVGAIAWAFGCVGSAADGLASRVSLARGESLRGAGGCVGCGGVRLRASRPCAGLAGCGRHPGESIQPAPVSMRVARGRILAPQQVMTPAQQGFVGPAERSRGVRALLARGVVTPSMHSGWPSLRRANACMESRETRLGSRGAPVEWHDASIAPEWGIDGPKRASRWFAEPNVGFGDSMLWARMSWFRR